MVLVEILFLAIESLVVLTIIDAEHFTDPPSFLSIYHSGRDLILRAFKPKLAHILCANKQFLLEN